MRNVILEATKRYMDECGQRLITDIIEEHKIGEVDGVTVIHYPDMLHMFGFIIAASLTIPVDCIGNRTTIIVVDDRWMGVRPKIKNWILFHEIGHIVHGDLERAIENGETNQERLLMRTAAPLIGKVSDEETNADFYAYERTSAKDSFEALTWMKEQFPNWMLNREIRLRIKSLKRRVH